MRYLIAAALLAAAPAAAQSMPGMDMKGMDMSAMKNTPENPYMEAMMQMDQRMMAAKGANPAETWTRMMIEHHRGAIAMSDIAVAKAHDSATVAEARKTAAMQKTEIAKLNAMLAKEGKRPQ